MKKNITNKPIARLFATDKEIWDWRNMSLKDRLKIALSLVLTGIVDINWGNVNNINLQ